MERRELLRALASAAALTALSPDKTLAAWSRVASGIPLSNDLSPAHMALVRAIADTIIPRTDTPGATDVGVHKFVDVIVNEYLPETERTAGLAGLDAIDARARTESNVAFAQLSAEKRSATSKPLFWSAPMLMNWFPGKPNDGARTRWRMASFVFFR